MTRETRELERLEELLGNAIARLDELERYALLRSYGLGNLQKQVRRLRDRVTDLESTNEIPISMRRSGRGAFQRSIGRTTSTRR